MDRSSYKTVKTKRGFNYNYYASVPDRSSNKPTILFLHGFPSTSYDWRRQVEFFAPKGFPIIVPDLLGYGGTDKPMDAQSYKWGDMAGDVIDILDAEKVEKVIAIGHDWGSALTSRLACHYGARFVGFVLMAVGHLPSFAKFDYDGYLALLKGIVGYEPYGYWEFFAEKGSEDVIKSHPESFVSLAYPIDPLTWRDSMSIKGNTKKWVTSDTQVPLAEWVTEEDRRSMSETIVTHGLGGALNWYRILLAGIQAKDDEGIPESNFVINQPVFYIYGSKDCLSLPSFTLAGMTKLCPDLTAKEFDTSHWVPMEAPGPVNAALLEWIETKVEKGH